MKKVFLSISVPLALVLGIGLTTAVLILLGPEGTASAAGTTYYVNAATGDDSRTPGDATSIETPWKTITHAVATVPAGTAGMPNVISVAAGTHDSALGETFPISMSNAHVSLVGAGAGSSIVDGGGTADIFHIAAEGIRIEGFTIRDAAEVGIESGVGSFTITHNAFDMVDFGVYMSLDEDHKGGTYSIGDMHVISNTFAMTDTGVRVEIHLDNNNVLSDTSITMGDVNVFSNTFNSLGSADEYAVVVDLDFGDIENGSFEAGDTNISYNHVNGPFDDGIYIESHIGDIRGATTVSAGDLNIIKNIISDGAGGDTSIEYYYYYYLNDFYDQATVNIGDITIKDNQITNAGYGIYGYIFEGTRFYDDVKLTFGDLTIENNTIDGFDSEGITVYIESISDLFDNASFESGKTWIRNNTLTNGDDYGIYYETEIDADLEGSANVTIGPVWISNNVVELVSSDPGIEIRRHGDYMDDSARVSVGSARIISNTVSGGFIELNLRDVGSSVFNDTTTTYSPTYIISNTIGSTSEPGVLVEFSNVANKVSGNAAVDIGDVHIKNNDLSGGEAGVVIDYDPSDVYRDITGSAAVLMPDYHIHNNVIAEAKTGFQSGAYGNGVVDFIHNTVASPNLSSGAGIEVITGMVRITNTIVSKFTIGISTTGGIVSEDYTLFSGSTDNYAGVVSSGGNSFNGAPGFVDPAGGDYRLKKASEAIDAGVDAGVYQDRDGNLRPMGAGFDIGAFEYLLNLLPAGYFPIIFK